MNKKNLPNIPIYIGDWERDCNVLSLTAEAAWLRIVFKLWSKGKQNAIKMPTKSLQNLWRCNPDKMQGILHELIYNEIAEIQQEQDFVTFTCRRFVKENELSEIRSNARKQNKKENKTQSKHNQNNKKTSQNTDIESDNESVIENKPKDKRGSGGKKKIPTLEEFLNYADEKAADLDIELDIKMAKSKYLAWKDNNWHTIGSKNNPSRQIKNWKSTITNSVIHWQKQNQNGKGNRIKLSEGGGYNPADIPTDFGA